MATLKEIEEKTKEYAYARSQLAEKLQALEEEIAAVKKKHITGLKRSVTVAATYQSRLHAAIEESPDLFKRPRTQVIYGVKIGFQKGKGELKIDNPDHVVKLIKRYFADRTEDLIKTTETPIKKTLSNMSGADLKKLGLEIVETGDQVVIKSTDSEVDKLVDAMLKDEMQDAA